MKTFIPMLAAHSGVKDGALLEQDVRLHFLLKDLVEAPGLEDRLVFRGGTCLVKCYLGYYRFSVDLDFTATGGDEISKLGGKAARRALRPLARKVQDALAAHAAREELRFDPNFDLKYRQNGKLMAALLHYEDTTRRPRTIKVDVNFAEPLEFAPQIATARGLLRPPYAASIQLINSDLPDRYGTPVEVKAYDPQEIVAEKGRALLTRKAAKTRDLIDLFLLEQELGLRLEDLLPSVRAKTAYSLAAAGTYRENLELIETRFDFMLEENPASLVLKTLDLAKFDKFRARVLAALVPEARVLKAGASEARSGRAEET